MNYRCMRCGCTFDGERCPVCGTPRPTEKYCPRCGAICPAEALYCAGCGHSFSSEKDEPSPVPFPEPKAPRRDEDGTKEPDRPRKGPARQRAERRERTLERCYAVFGFVPIVLFAVFSVLLIFLYFAPAAVPTSGELADGSASYGNVFQLLYDKEVGIGGVMATLLAFWAVCFAAAAVLFALSIKQRKLNITMGNTSVSLPTLYGAFGALLMFVMFIVGCTACGQISASDGGSGLVSPGLAPVLVLSLSLVFAMLSAVSIAVEILIGRKILYPGEDGRDSTEDMLNEQRELDDMQYETYVPGDEQTRAQIEEISREIAEEAARPIEPVPPIEIPDVSGLKTNGKVTKIVSFLCSLVVVVLTAYMLSAYDRGTGLFRNGGAQFMTDTFEIFNLSVYALVACSVEILACIFCLFAGGKHRWPNIALVAVCVATLVGAVIFIAVSAEDLGGTAAVSGMVSWGVAFVITFIGLIGGIRGTTSLKVLKSVNAVVSETELSEGKDRADKVRKELMRLVSVRKYPKLVERIRKEHDKYSYFEMEKQKDEKARILQELTYRLRNADR